MTNARFTRRHYEALAETISESLVIDGNDGNPLGLVIGLMDMLERDNPKFSRARFIDACKLRDWVRHRYTGSNAD